MWHVPHLSMVRSGPMLQMCTIIATILMIVKVHSIRLIILAANQLCVIRTASNDQYWETVCRLQFIFQLAGCNTSLFLQRWFIFPLLVLPLLHHILYIFS
jgi:hypothetical protein